MIEELKGAPNFRGVAGQVTAAGARVRGRWPGRGALARVELSGSPELRSGSGRAQVALGGRIDDARAAVRPAAGAAPGDEVLAEIAAVDVAFLEASFSAVEEPFGTVDGYLAGACGPGRAARERFLKIMTR